MTDDLPDGIYFSLDETAYHGLPRLSASGVMNLMASPATFWANSWMNPDKTTGDEEATKAQILGRAYDVAYLTPDKFQDLYTRLIDPEDYEIKNGSGLKAEFKKLGLPQTKEGETVLEASERLRAHGYGKPLYHIDLEQQKDDGKIAIRGDYFDDLITDAERFNADPEVSRLVQGGFAQVSILWTDEKTGIKWKARLDYLNPIAIVDLKTFANPSGKKVNQCLADAVRFNRLYIQGVVYWQALERIRASDDVQQATILRDATAEQRALIGNILQGDAGPLEYWWVFVEKGVPNILLRQFRMTNDPHPHHLYQAPDKDSREEFRQKMQRPGMLFQRGKLEIEDAAKTFLQCMEIWGTDEPWGSLEPVGEIGDADFNPSWLEE